jgi:hypothetical protein
MIVIQIEFCKLKFVKCHLHTVFSDLEPQIKSGW